ncbi:kinase-like protein [Stemphylium lycopersici]|nr:kinase-like protein [Stemphylium lycopersici]
MASSNWQVQQAAGPQPSDSPAASCNNTLEDGASPHSNKVVSFPDDNTISPLLIGKTKELDQKDYLDLDKPPRHYPASVSRKRLSARPSYERMGSSKSGAAEGNPSLNTLLSDNSVDTGAHGQQTHENLLKQVGAWLKQERSRRHARKAKRKDAKNGVTDHEPAEDTAADTPDQPDARHRSGSESSHGEESLDQLANILEKTLAMKPAEVKKRTNLFRRSSTGLKRHSAISLDSDYFESVDQLVPSCEATLDNSKTMAYNVDEPGTEPNHDVSEREARKEKEAWTKFRAEILRLIHTLKLKGWRKVPNEQSNEIDVQRLSGALTNAVYVVSPPKNLAPPEQTEDGPPKPRNPPPKLLLRIYGPQVEHLIDRESELQTLTRLARKRIGPCLLGTFSNGRFEEFLHAQPLTAKELRNPDTSVQIAKRMRELHEGIDLLKEERKAGPFVWQNWDKWVDRCEYIVTWLDQQVRESKQDPSQANVDKWKKRGYVCGVEWPMFRQMIDKYRSWLEEQYGGIDKINERMIFAHNDTQYGNILRMMPEGESPLMLPANQHKQLVVIDFEYANANLPGLEFANHFIQTEWAYNYHDPEASWRCNTKHYPTIEEQHRFIQAYLMHNPSYKAAGGYTSNPATPHLGPLPSSGSTTALTATAAPSSISAFMLDSRAPPGERYQEQEAQSERQMEEETRRLLAETKLWRLANSAMWVAWGIVQAHVPGLPDFDEENEKTNGNPSAEAAMLDSATAEIEAEAEAEQNGAGIVSEETAEQTEAQAQADQDADLFKPQDEEEFDYLTFANDRAMFVWGDALRMGIVSSSDLPEELLNKIKLVEY